MIMEAFAVIHIVNKHIRFGVEKSRLFISHSNVGLFSMCKCLKSLQINYMESRGITIPGDEIAIGCKKYRYRKHFLSLYYGV